MKRKRADNRSRQANWKDIQRAAGLCPGCGQERRDFNARTGKPYSLGPTCRVKQNERMRVLMARRRRRGIA